MDGAFPTGPDPLPMPALPLRRRQVVPSSVLGMLIFAVAETMFFAGMISAFTISRANQLPGNWPPPGQPMLPASSTAFNTAALLLSGAVLLFANRAFARGPASTATRVSVSLAWVLGVTFVALQGREWQQLLAQGLSVTSSTMGSFFFLIVGAHAVHAIGALLAMGGALVAVWRGTLGRGYFFGVQTFWYFVVLMWPVIYARVYF